MTEIEDYAFYYAKMGKAILPDGVTNIGDYAFAYCTNMTELNIPQSTESCGDKYSVVKGCRKLEKLTAPANVLQGSMSLASLKTLVINGGTSSMGSLSGCGNLETVVLPEGLTDITTRAFKDCKNLTTINLPSTLTTINQNAFEGCEKITSLTMPSSLKTIGKNAFLNSGLENVVLNEGLTEISGGAFDNTKITSIKIPDSLTRCTYWTNVKTLETVYCPAKWADSLYGYQYQNEASTIRHLYITSGTTIATPKAQGLVSISLPASITSTTLNLRFQYALCQVTNLSACNITLPDDFAGEYRTSESDAFSGTFEKDDKDMLVYKYQEKVVALKYYGSKTQIGESDLAGYTDIAPYAFTRKILRPSCFLPISRR
ncbi:MAG: leucine-rich repeat domain-containing protein [Clostridiales bacterium]|nr:MAG: leucine-rich repeat domain-containing protein [Clostridiales bacterium]